MEPFSYNVSVPGSLMLFGEHAVLYGRPALVAAVTSRMHLQVTSLPDRELQVHSVLGHYTAPLDRLTPDPAFRFVLHAIAARAEELHGGLKVTIESDFSHTIGFGSSAAVTAGMHAALQQVLDASIDADRLFHDTRATIRAVQGRGSGADAAASVYGGVQRIRNDSVERIMTPALPQLMALYAGYKTSTADVIRRVAEKYEVTPSLFEALFDVMALCTEQAGEAFNTGAWQDLGAVMDIHHGCQSALGVSDHTLEQIIHTLRGRDGLYGAKISGSGLGDCVLAVGRTDVHDLPYEYLEVDIDPQGVTVE